MSNWEKTMKEWDDSIPDGIKHLSAEKQVLMRRVRELESENERLKECQRWIPVSERLPEDGQYVAMLDPNPYSDSGWEYCHHVYDRLYSQLPKKAYWMPLPEPPEVEQ